MNPPTLISFNNPSTFISTLTVSGTTILNNAATCSSTLNVVGNITTSGLSVFTINSNLNSISSYSYLNLSSTSSLLSTKQNNLTFLFKYI